MRTGIFRNGKTIRQTLILRNEKYFQKKLFKDTRRFADEHHRTFLQAGIPGRIFFHYHNHHLIPAGFFAHRTGRENSLARWPIPRHSS